MTLTFVFDLWQAPNLVLDLPLSTPLKKLSAILKEALGESDTSFLKLLVKPILHSQVPMDWSISLLGSPNPTVEDALRLPGGMMADTDSLYYEVNCCAFVLSCAFSYYFMLYR